MPRESLSQYVVVCLFVWLVGWFVCWFVCWFVVVFGFYVGLLFSICSRLFWGSEASEAADLCRH